MTTYQEDDVNEIEGFVPPYHGFRIRVSVHLLVCMFLRFIHRDLDHLVISCKLKQVDVQHIASMPIQVQSPRN